VISIPWLTLTLVAPLVLAYAAAAQRRITRGFAVGGAAACLAAVGIVAGALAFGDTPSRMDPWQWHGAPVLAIDVFSASMSIACAVLVLVVTMVLPRREIAPGSVAALFVTEALVLGTFAMTRAVPLVIVWSAVGLPAWALARGSKVPRVVSRTAGLLLLGTALPLVGIVALHHGTVDSVMLGALVVAVLGRMGLVPFHSWLAPMLAEAPSSVALPLVGSCTGPYLLARFAVPLAAWSSRGLSLLGALAVVGAVYAALLALGERRLRYAVVYILMSESSLVFAGLCTADPHAIRGAMLFSIGESFAATGLLVATRALEARVGTIDLSRYHGLYRSMPRIASVHLVCALAAVGFPGFACYVGEDLLLEGETHRQLALGIALAAVAALNGITALRAFARAFLGPASPNVESVPADLLPRKRLVFVALLVGQLAFGLLPMTILRSLPVGQSWNGAAEHGGPMFDVLPSTERQRSR
jgi:NADH-quinone oxidoreductase subunit M